MHKEEVIDFDYGIIPMSAYIFFIGFGLWMGTTALLCADIKKKNQTIILMLNLPIPIFLIISAINLAINPNIAANPSSLMILFFITGIVGFFIDSIFILVELPKRVIYIIVIVGLTIMFTLSEYFFFISDELMSGYEVTGLILTIFMVIIFGLVLNFFTSIVYLPKKGFELSKIEYRVYRSTGAITALVLGLTFIPFIPMFIYIITTNSFWLMPIGGIMYIIIACILDTVIYKKIYKYLITRSKKLKTEWND